MTTALTLITDALVEINAHDLGQAVPAEDAALGLRYLNRMMQRWTNSPGMFPVLPEVSVPMTGAASYTIGPTGDVVAARPVRIQRATFVLGNVEYPVDVLNRDQWDTLAVKDATGAPVSRIWYDASVTNGRVYTYPIADTGTLKLDAASLLASFATLATSLTLPEGYESAIVLTLAIDLSGAYQRPISGDLRARAAGAVRAIKRTNTEPLMVSVGLGATQDFEIERGY